MRRAAVLACLFLAVTTACGRGDGISGVVDSGSAGDATNDAGPEKDATQPKDGAADGSTTCVDFDEDTFGQGCAAGPDCNDRDAATYPGAAEVCNGSDDDCDDQIDEEIVLPSCALTEGVCAGALASCGGELGIGACGPAEYGTDYEAEESQCDGLDNDCDGSTDEGCECAEGDVQSCGVDTGECQMGEQRCGEDGTFGSCDGAVGPMGEVCDGLDNDCDDTADEPGDLVPPDCSLQNGVCRGAKRTCGGAEGWLRCEGTDSYGSMYEATETLCDGLDNDCDGTTDEGCECMDGSMQSCGTDVGACQSGAQRCTSGAWGACTGATGPADETCNGTDDDCDTRTDESITAPACALQSGVCAGATAQCGGAAGFLACGSTEYGPRYETTETTCDGFDNDCDGTVDEGCPCVVGRRQACGTSVGVCERGEQVCTATGWGPCEGDIEPADEICDGLDNDCDGPSDDNLVPPACALTDGVCAGRTQQCGGPSGWIACSGPESYGPSYVTVEDGAVDERICDGLDNDCDGTADEGCRSGPILSVAEDVVFPAVYGQLVAFLADVNGNWDVFVLDRRTGVLRQITDTTEDEGAPDIYGPFVVFQRGAESSARVVLFDLEGASERTLTAARSENPRIGGSQVVWEDYRFGDWDIYRYDLSSDTEVPVVTSIADEVAPDVRNGYVVYSKDEGSAFRVHLRDLTTSMDVAQNPSGTSNQVFARVDLEVFAFSDSRNATPPLLVTSNWDIFGGTVSAPTTEEMLVTNSGAQVLGDMDGGYLVWSDRRNGHWDVAFGPYGGSAIMLTSNNGTQSSPTISGDFVVWQDNRLGTYDLYGSQMSPWPVATAGQIRINEVLADPPPGSDVNRDGATSDIGDEMIELVNQTTVALSIGGFTLSDSASTRHTFAADAVIPAGGSIVVFGAPPGDGIFGGSAAVGSSTGNLSLANGGDTVRLRNGATVIDEMMYGSNGGMDQSLVRNPEYTGGFVLHGTVSANPTSPGTTSRGFGF